MKSKQGITGVAALMVGLLLAIAFTGNALAGNGVPRGMTAQQWNAMLERSRALNRFYGPESPRAEAQRAVERRNEAINRYYHLGRYAAVRVSSRFDWADAGIGAGAMLGAIFVAGGLTLTVRRRVVGQAASPSTT